MAEAARANGDTDIATANVGGGIWRLNKLNAALANPKLNTENDAEEFGNLDAVRKHGMSLMAYSPLGKGILTGAFRDVGDLPSDDRRHEMHEAFLALACCLVCYRRLQPSF